MTVDEIIEKLDVDYARHPELSNYPELFSEVYSNIVKIMYKTNLKEEQARLINCTECAIFELAHKKMVSIKFAENGIKSKKEDFEKPSILADSTKKNLADNVKNWNYSKFLKDEQHNEITLGLLREYLGEIFECNPGYIGVTSRWIEDNIGKEIKDMKIDVNF